MTRAPAKANAVRALGTNPIVADGLDPGAVMTAVGAARPEVIVHQMTALSNMGGNLRRFDRDFELTNRLRTEGTDALLAAARKSGARRFVAQSFAGWPYAREGGWVKTETIHSTRAHRRPCGGRSQPSATWSVPSCTRTASTASCCATAPSTARGPRVAADGQHAELVRRGRFPIVGEGMGHWSFVHVDDAVAATVAAIEGGEAGIYNVVDDEPAPVSQWLPHLAEALGAKPPRRIPRWVGRLATGEVGVSLMTQIRGASNEKARREFGWRPRHRSWRSGFHEGLYDSASEGRDGEPTGAPMCRAEEVVGQAASGWRPRPSPH